MRIRRTNRGVLARKNGPMGQDRWRSAGQSLTMILRFVGGLGGETVLPLP